MHGSSSTKRLGQKEYRRVGILYACSMQVMGAGLDHLFGASVSTAHFLSVAFLISKQKLHGTSRYTGFLSIGVCAQGLKRVLLGYISKGSSDINKRKVPLVAAFIRIRSVGSRFTLRFILILFARPYRWARALFSLCTLHSCGTV